MFLTVSNRSDCCFSQFTEYNQKLVINIIEYIARQYKASNVSKDSDVLFKSTGESSSIKGSEAVRCVRIKRKNVEE